MSESYKKIYPGNCVNHLNAYANPNDDFKANGRGVSDPRDRKQQALMFCPGWVAVRKVGYAHINEAATQWDVVVPSPDLRPDDKPRADIIGLFIPTGALVVRAGLRVPAVNAQPGYYSSGSRQEADQLGSGLIGTAGDKIVLGSAVAAAPGVNAGGIATKGTLVVDADGNLPIGTDVVQTKFGLPVEATADLTLKLFASGSGISSTIIGGAYVPCEVVYLLPEDVAGIDSVLLPGARYAGFGS